MTHPLSALRRAGRRTPTAERTARGPDRAQSETVGVILLTGAVVVAVGVAGALFLSQTGADAADDGPLVDANVSVTAAEVVVTHAGGDAVAVADLAVVVRGDGSSTRYAADPAAVDGDGDDLFEPTERFSVEHGLASDASAAVLVVHVPSNTVLAHAYADAP